MPPTEAKQGGTTRRLWHTYSRSHHGHHLYADRGQWRLRGVHRASILGRSQSDFQPYSNRSSGRAGDGGAASALDAIDSKDSEDATAGASTFPADPTRTQQQEDRPSDDRTSRGTSPDSLRRTDGPYLSTNSLNHSEGQTTAAGIFFGSSLVGSSSMKLGDRRSGAVDGIELAFVLCEAINEKPKTSRLERTQRTIMDENVKRSGVLIRCRLYLMKLGFVTLSFLYLASFVVLNVIFAGLYYIPTGRCCDDPELTYYEVFDFSVQTSATIGYGGYVPQGFWANFLVVVQSCLAIVLSAIYTGLLFSMFQTPHAKLEFSDLITLSNVNGMPCLELRVGNVDGTLNPIMDAEARLCFSYLIEYEDENGKTRYFSQSEYLHLMSDRREALNTVWTLRHCIDEHSPLFGMHFNEWPGSSIREFRVSVQATQDITKARVSVQSVYQLEDILVGYRFVDQIRVDQETNTLVSDYAYMSEIVPQPVWYPVRTNL